MACSRSGVGIGISVGGLIAAAGLVVALPATALTLRECGAAYKAAQRAGKLGGMSWQAFRKARCGPATAPGGAPGSAAAAPRLPGPAAGGSAYLPGRAVFPNAISPKHADEPPGKARRQTCLDQYKLNRARDANGGLKWVQKGGGYYGECNKRLRTGGKD